MDRILPAAQEAERTVLASAILVPESLAVVVERVTPEYFAYPPHRVIYEAIAELDAAGSPVDIPSVSMRAERLAAQRGEPWDPGLLGEIAQDVASTAGSAAYYCDILQGCWVRRTLITGAAQITATAYDEEDISPLLARAEDLAYSAADPGRQRGLVPAGTVVAATTAAWERIYSEGSRGIKTGLPDLDAITGGLLPSDLTIIAGRPGHGKTSLGLKMAITAAQAGVPTAIFSLEMAAEQLFGRLAAAEARVDGHRLRAGTLPQRDLAAAGEALRGLAGLPLYIDDSPQLGIHQLRAKVRRIKGLGLVVVDYLQLMEAHQERGESRVLALGKISRALKIMAKTLDIPVVALSQLNRQNEHQGIRRPRLSDLRECGDLEQDSDNVLFVFREELYARKPENQGIAEIIIGKQRNGPAGISIKATFVEKTASFEPLSWVPEPNLRQDTDWPM